MSPSENWRPTAPLETLKLRAQILTRVRTFFGERSVTEVETPILSQTATVDPHLSSMATRYTGPYATHGNTLYLHTSPEFPMKRLLAAGSGDIYQICKVFRDGEYGRRHNPEFTMLEWYRLNYDHIKMMDEVETLVTDLLHPLRSLAPSERLTYREAFVHYTGVDPYTADAAMLHAVAHDHGIKITQLAPNDPDAWLDLLLTHLIEPHLGHNRLTFVYDYPASQAALARLRSDNPTVAERFELYLDGIELANGFHELASPEEQRQRFIANCSRRQELGLDQVPFDQWFLDALTAGLPNCAGVALGIDRLVMTAIQAASIDEVLSFPIHRA